MRPPILVLALALGGVASTAQLHAQRPAAIPPGEWRSYHRDLHGSRYSPLDQITASNIDRLAQAWVWRPDTSDKPSAQEVKNESTPLMVKGVLYFTTGLNRSVVAADPATGATKWIWRLDEGAARIRVSPRRGAGRGVSYWSDGKEQRIFVVTPGFHLVALDAVTGKLVSSFGANGVVDLKLQLGVPLDPDSAAIGNSSPPLVFEDFVVVGPALEVGLQPRSRRNVPGRILAIDARSGKLRWRFNTIPQRGEFGNETWENASETYTGNAGAWAPFSLDEKRGYLYIPVEAATGDYYGGHRHGDNLFSTTLLCVDVRTGRRVWHYQIVHHDIFDWDNPTAPILADLTVAGRRVEAVVQLTKQANAYVLDRVTGKPVWPIVERAVPRSDVPGERSAPTQPIPTRPAPYDRQGVTVSDLIDFTPALRAEAERLVKPYRLGAFFTPSSLANAADGTRGTLALPGAVGGTNWEHGAYDPGTGILYVGSQTNPSVLAMAHVPERSDMDFIQVGGEVPTVQGLPLIKPPYSRITAIDLNRGEHLWMVANGATPAAVRDNPALKGLTFPPTGGFTRPMLLATRTLLFVAEGWGGAPVLRALDKRTGKTLREWQLAGSVSSSPMSYAIAGKQYVAFWVSVPGRNPGSELVVMGVVGGS